VPEPRPSGADFEGLLRALVVARVDFIVVGGVAAFAHGSARLTLDLDVVYSRRPENLDRLVAALAPLNPYLRGAPPGLPFLWDAETLRRGLNFTLRSELGDVDVLGEIAGGGTYDALLPHSEETTLFGLPCRCLGLEKLIQAKRAAGRRKDLEAIAELEAIWEERRKRGL
jgi:hypothetical protein